MGGGESDKKHPQGREYDKHDDAGAVWHRVNEVREDELGKEAWEDIA